jgi:fructokinase
VRHFASGVVSTYPVRKVEVVSTVGAGDNFNAGVLYGLVRNNVTREKLRGLSAEEWDCIISHGLDFSSHACTLIENYVDKAWAAEYVNRQ